VAYTPHTPELPPAPPDEQPPEPAPEPARWPAWYAPLGFFTALVVTVIVMAIVGAFAAVGGAEVNQDSQGFTIAGTLVQYAAFTFAALMLASQTLRPQPWHFGLRRARLWPTVGWTFAVLVAFFVFQGVYGAIVNPDEEQGIPESLGVDEGIGWLVLAAIVVVAVAPVAEEFFFRGFFYRALRNGLVPRLGARGGILLAAAIDGLLFGTIHLPPLDLFVPLAVLGFVFCLLYERTGTLYSTIGFHAINNFIAFSILVDDGWVAALPIAAVMITACLVLPRVLPGHVPEPQAVAP
jgi:uncharacterized protein